MSRSTAYIEGDDPVTGALLQIPVAEIPCPSCGSRAKQCKRPSGHGASQWHAARTTLAHDLLEAGTTRCQWWALCTRLATTTRPHPILGDVPICEPCTAIVDRLDGAPAAATTA